MSTMALRITDPATDPHDVVMSWLQNREMKDNKLADARSGVIASAAITAVIGRTQELAQLAFPDVDPNTINSLVREYVQASLARMNA